MTYSNSIGKPFAPAPGTKAWFRSQDPGPSPAPDDDDTEAEGEDDTDDTDAKPKASRPRRGWISDYDRAVASNVASGMSKGQAIAGVARDLPEIHQRYIAAVNHAHLDPAEWQRRYGNL